MILYRLIKSDFAHDAWSGQGARLYGGRWNHKGTSAVYVSTQISLATLEILVHLNQERLLNHYNLFSIEISDKQVMRLPLEHLPDDWQNDPAPTSTMDIGTAWLTDNASVALLIPSCVIPYEYNAIINPNHPQFTKAINSIKPLDFSFDARLK
ncbi:MULTISPECIES: RES family NAD+ phosphorylase [Providencia]|uniref:RES family NAD+ phosphorylase n=1 Tax=Providencia TaxID=586 RepID=UPI0008387F48|nr:MULTISPECIES: RES domain-containing protein [Providencia]MBP6121328.1 RES domain-containing protein [Providencia sp.]MDD9340497.1 RES domain-containing protein [Providencia heimbachae]NIH22783.1 RES domain-containing protein [Providencia heimbachae]